MRAVEVLARRRALGPLHARGVVHRRRQGRGGGRVACPAAPDPLGRHQRRRSSHGRCSSPGRRSAESTPGRRRRDRSSLRLGRRQHRPAVGRGAVLRLRRKPSRRRGIATVLGGGALVGGRLVSGRHGGVLGRVLHPLRELRRGSWRRELPGRWRLLRRRRGLRCGLRSEGWRGCRRETSRRS